MRQFRITDLVAAASIALSLTAAACDGGDTPKEAPAAEKPAEAKPDEAKPDEAKPDEAKPDEVAKPEEVAKPDEAKPEDDAKPEDTPADAKPEADKPAPKKTPKPEKAAAPAIDAKPLFLAKCKSCHGEDGRGKTKYAEKTPVPDLHGSKLSKAKIVDVIANGVPDSKMKGFKDKFSKDEIDAIAAYVKKL